MMTKLQHDIVDILGDDRATAGQIARALGLDRATVQAALEEMDKQGIAGSAIRVVEGIGGCEFWSVSRRFSANPTP